MLKLYHNDMSSCAQKVRITLAEKGLPWEGFHLSLRKGEARTEEYKKLNPIGSKKSESLFDNGKFIGGEI